MAVPASHPSLCARFVKEAAVQKRTALLPDIDMIDCAIRQENLNFAGQPIMLQLPLVPAYALTVHKTQVLACAVRDVCMRVARWLADVLDVHVCAQVYPDYFLKGAVHQAFGAGLSGGRFCSRPRVCPRVQGDGPRQLLSRRASSLGYSRRTRDGPARTGPGRGSGVREIGQVQQRIYL